MSLSGTRVRVLTLVVLALAAVFALAACGGDDDSAAPAEPPAAAAPEPAPAPVPEPAPQSAPSTGSTTGGCGDPAPFEQGTPIEAGVEVNGEERMYLLFVPSGYGGEPSSLVLVFHGRAGIPDSMPTVSGFDELAESEGFIVAYPDGKGDWDFYAGAMTGDIAFMDALLDKLSGELCIDEERIYASGISAGAAFSSALACRLSDRIAAIAPAAGQPLYPDDCEAERPIPLVDFHGTADEVIPFDSGNDLSTYSYGSIEEEAAERAEANGCQSGRLEQTVTATISQVSYRDCQDSADVVVYVFEGRGHSWPPRDEEFDGTLVAWEFFQEHPLVP